MFLIFLLNRKPKKRNKALIEKYNKKSSDKSILLRIVIYIILLSMLFVYFLKINKHKKESVNPNNSKQNISKIDKIQIYSEKLTPLIHKYDKFKYVQVGSYTGDGGQLIIFGIIKKKEDKLFLDELIRSMDVKVPVYWNLEVSEEQYNILELSE